VSRRLRRAGGLLITLALVLLIMPARAGAPERALHVVYVSAGDAQPSTALRAWLERRGIVYEVAWLGLAMRLDEAEAEALGERDDVLLLRAPFPSEPLPDLDAAPITPRVWLPVVGR
jgi:hypothetical protein